jgi:hypothetical protein
MRRAIKRSYSLLIIAALVIIGAIVLMNTIKSFSLGDLFNFDFFKNRTTINHGAVILEAVKKQAKLETITMLERTDNTVQKKDGLCVERVRYFGLITVTAGVDLQEIKASDIVVSNNAGRPPTISITLPSATILHIETSVEDKPVKERELAVGFLCRKGSQMDQAIIEAQNAAKDDAKKSALSAGILEKAEEQASGVLRALLKNVQYPDVVIKYSRRN